MTSTIDSLNYCLYDMTRDAFNQITPETQSPLIHIPDCADTIQELVDKAGLIETHDFITQTYVQVQIKRCITECMCGVFADGVVTLSDVPMVMKTVKELAKVMNSMQEKRIGYAEIRKDAIAPLIECILSILLQMMIPKPLLAIVQVVLKQSMELLGTDVLSHAPDKPWFCCIFH